MTYALALDNPPLLVVCDRNIIQIHTHFTGTPSEVHTVLLADIGLPENLQKLRWLFEEPERFRPAKNTFAVTEEAARRMGDAADRLTGRGNDPQAVAHFLIQCVFCMFAEDAGLLPQKLFETVLEKSNPDGKRAQSRLSALFAAMQGGGDFGAENIPWFNGGLFKEIAVPALETADVAALLEAARMNWNAIEPAILGTLFERGLNPDMRSQLGAHYTDPETILKLIRPVIEAPLRAEWETVKTRIASAKKDKDKAALFVGYLERLKAYRVLDPACGSGNFLYLALKTLKDLEHRANLDAEALGMQRQLGIETGPANVLGIELNPYAAELARVTVWIGELQWMLSHGYPVLQNPILRALDRIEQRDAVLGRSPLPNPPPLAPARSVPAESGGIAARSGETGEGAMVKSDCHMEPAWPEADAIVGNPPFLGGSKKRGELGDAYFEGLNTVYKNRVPGGADLVTYWFEKARAQIEAGKAKAAGLVATNSIRGGANRKVLERILDTTRIFEAWSDEPWVNNGAAVRVSLVCFGDNPLPSPPPLAGEGTTPSPTGGGLGRGAVLDGQAVAGIHADLTGAGAGLDLTLAKRLAENAGVSFQGTSKKASFDIPGELARQWLRQPNPNGKPNSEVVRPWSNGLALSGRSSDTWIIDFGIDLSENQGALYETPFKYAIDNVKPERDKNNREAYRKYWWRHAEARPGMRAALVGMQRFIATIAHSKYRFFVWLDASTCPDQALIVIARPDDATFGILHSRFHELWSLRMGTSLEDRPRYTPTTTFETFPFPPGFAPSSPALLPPGEGSERISAAAQTLDQLRNNWLNPPEWVDWVRTKEEEKAGFPLRPVAKPGFEAELKKRTLTNLYNARPAWLDNAHKALDSAVATAYGWEDYSPDMTDGEILRRLLGLNLGR